MTKCKPDPDMRGLESALGDLVSAQLGLGKELLKVFLAGSGQLVDRAMGLRLPRGSSCCDIPDPCWMPKSLGEVCCQLRRGDSGEVCLTIVNEDFRPQRYEIAAAGRDAGTVSIATPQIMLGPKERHVIAVKLTVPAQKDDDRDETGCCACDDLDIVIWVKGCQNHYLRWVVCITESSKDCCHHVCVADAPDYELHWYDHFHIMRSCPDPVRTA